MHQIELDFMRGMVSILNEVSEVYYNTGESIITNEQYDVRLQDLKQLEEETGVVFANSPTIKDNQDTIFKAKYFVCNQEFDSAKLEKMKELGIKIITEEELENELVETLN